MPFALASLVFSAVGTGLVSTFRVDTSTDRWVGYQILLGFGTGLGVQMVSTTLMWSFLLTCADYRNYALIADPRYTECS